MADLDPITRQEKIIAGEDIQPVTRLEHFLKKYRGGSGGVVSWNDLTDKPFGEVIVSDTCSFSISDPSELENLVVVGEQFVKINDAVITEDDLANGFTYSIGDESFEVPADGVSENVDPVVDGVIIIGEVFLSVADSGTGVDLDGMVFPESGLYTIEHFVYAGVAITIPSYTGFKSESKLNEKYLPTEYLPKKEYLQPDWEQVDETAKDFIKNKPFVGRIRLFTETVNGVVYITETFDGEPITASRMDDIMTTYGAGSVSVDNQPITCYGQHNGYYIIFYETILISGENISTIRYKAYTAEYTPPET